MQKICIYRSRNDTSKCLKHIELQKNNSFEYTWKSGRVRLKLYWHNQLEDEEYLLKKRCYFYFLFRKKRRFLQEHGHAFAFLMIIIRAWSCTFFLLYYVCHLFSRSRNTNRIHLRARALLFGYKEEKKRKTRRTILNACSYVRRHCQAWSMSFFCLLSIISYVLAHTLKLGSNDETSE